MGSNILLEGQAPYETGVLKLHLERQIVINISAQEAQKKINQFVHWEISSQMHAEPPTLVVGDIHSLIACPSAPRWYLPI